MSQLLELPRANGNGFHAPKTAVDLTAGSPLALPKPNKKSHAPKKTKRVTDTLVISDLHLGSEVCRADEILKVLSQWKFRRLVILGDAFDDTRFRRLKRNHFKVLSRINKFSSPKRKIEVVWVEGNHDSGFFTVVSRLLGMPVHREYMFRVNGRKYLAIHGHQFDYFMLQNPLLTDIASWFYLMVQRRDTRRMALSRYLKRKSKVWLKLSEKQAIRAVRYARHRGADAVLCGHTHISQHRTNFGGIEYVNTGCWTDNPSHYVTIGPEGVTLHEVE